MLRGLRLLDIFNWCRWQVAWWSSQRTWHGAWHQQ